jgi:lipoprotein-anchoring transpeptidase ErfK/SrfK
MLNVDANQPVADHVVVDKSDGVLRVLDKDDHLIAQFSATMGSEHDPLPIGSWTIKGADYNPKFRYNPALFWDAKKGDEKELLPPGPNGPVGVVWLDLSKPHYGIHGTPHPELIGRSESHGCIRLTNWDVARLSMMVKPGTKAVFQA